MKKGKRAVIKLLIIIISLCFVDGGRSFFILNENLQIQLAPDQANDIELPHQQHIANFHDEEKWLNSFSFDFFCFSLNSAGSLFTENYSSREYPDLIWQPPKFV